MTDKQINMTYLRECPACLTELGVGMEGRDARAAFTTKDLNAIRCEKHEEEWQKFIAQPDNPFMPQSLTGEGGEEVTSEQEKQFFEAVRARLEESNDAYIQPHDNGWLTLDGGFTPVELRMIADEYDRALASEVKE